MRDLAVLVAVAIVAAWAMVGKLPVTAANAGAVVTPPVAQLREIRSIAFDGRRLPSAQLRAVLETRAGDPLDAAALARDREAMTRVLAGLGYLAARVEPAAVSQDASGAYVIFDIDQGKVFHLRSVSVTGPGKAAVVLTIAPGDDAIASRIEQARQSLADGLARRGKPAAVELSTTTDLAAAAVDVVLTTHEPARPHGARR